MKDLLLFLFEYPQCPFDEEIVRCIEAQKRGQLYGMDVIRIRLGAETEQPDGENLLWQVGVDEEGRLAAREQTEEIARQLTTALFGRICRRMTDRHEAVFLGSVADGSAMAALQLGDMLYRQLLSMCVMDAHVLALIDQLTFNHRGTAAFLREIERFNQEPNPYYTNLFLLPWEAERRAETRTGVAALIKALAIGQGFGTGGKQTPGRIDSASVTTLSAPVRRVRARIAGHLLGSLMEKEIQSEPAQQVPAVSAKDLSPFVQEIVARVSGMEAAQQLPSLESLHAVMPMQDIELPQTGRDPSVAQAWEKLDALYAREDGNPLRSMLFLDAGEMKKVYESQVGALALLLMEQALEAGRKNGDAFQALPLLMEQIVIRARQRLKESSLPETEMRLDRALLPGKKRRAVERARARHLLLQTVYEDACRSHIERRRQLQEQLLQQALSRAGQYFADCMLRLRQELEHRRALLNMEEQHVSCYMEGFEEAYDYWCAHVMSESVGRAALYECCEAACDQPTMPEAVDKMVGRLMERVDFCTQSAMQKIQMSVSDFFLELKFRASQLAETGSQADLNRGLVDYLVARQNRAPLMQPITVDGRLEKALCAFILRRSVESDSFVQRIGQEGTSVLLVEDPFEKDVQMIVKYTGDALRNLVVYANNVQGG